MFPFLTKLSFNIFRELSQYSFLFLEVICERKMHGGLMVNGVVSLMDSDQLYSDLDEVHTPLTLSKLRECFINHFGFVMWKLQP